MATSLPNVARVAIEQQYEGQPCVNVLHFRTASGLAYDATTLSQLLDELNAAATSTRSWGHIIQSMDDSLDIVRLYGRTLSTTAPIEFERTGNAVVGNGFVNAPPMLAALVKWRTDIASRNFRGRSYIGGMGQAQIDPNDADRIVASHVTTISGRVTAFAQAWDADLNHTLVVLSRELRTANQPNPYSDVRNGVLDPIIRVQRRRRFGS